MRVGFLQTWLILTKNYTIDLLKVFYSILSDRFWKFEIFAFGGCDLSTETTWISLSNFPKIFYWDYTENLNSYLFWKIRITVSSWTDCQNLLLLQIFFQNVKKGGHNCQDCSVNIVIVPTYSKKKETLVSKLDIFLIFGQSKNGKFSAWNRKTEFSVSVSDFEPEMVLQSRLWLEKSTRRSAMKLIKVGDQSFTPTFLRPSVIWVQFEKYLSLCK